MSTEIFKIPTMKKERQRTQAASETDKTGEMDKKKTTAKEKTMKKKIEKVEEVSSSLYSINFNIVKCL